MRQVSWRHVSRRADGKGADSLMVGPPGVTVAIGGFTAKPDRGFNNAKGHGLRPVWLALRPRLTPAVAQYLGLDPKQIGLDRGGATQTPQQRCQPQHQFALDRGLGVIIRYTAASNAL
jgi:hypothetical protein